jgi:hypothetical protein
MVFELIWVEYPSLFCITQTSNNFGGRGAGVETNLKTSNVLFEPLPLIFLPLVFVSKIILRAGKLI